jgi:hypothetical protein
LGVYLTGAFLSDKIADWLVHRELISPANPFGFVYVRRKRHAF